MSRSCGVTLLAVCAVFLPELCQAGNYFTFPMGGRAASMAGAYTALWQDAACTWYNPGCLGFNEHSSLSLSASAFFLEMIRARDLVTVGLPSGWHGGDYKADSFQVVPASLTYVLRLNESSDFSHSLAFSVFVPVSDKHEGTLALDTVEAAQGGQIAYHQKFALQIERTRYVLGPTWGMSLGRHVAIGASLFVTYTRLLAQAGFEWDASTAEVAGNHVFTLSDMSFSGTELGLRGAIGFQMRALDDSLSFGLLVKTPELGFYSDSRGTMRQAQASPTGDDITRPRTAFMSIDTSKTSWEANQTGPLAFDAGAALRLGQVLLSADLDLRMPYHNDYMDESVPFVANGRAGLQLALGTRYWLGAGVFTDLAGNKRLAEFADSRIHFVGMTAGFTFASPYKVVESSETDRITFVTTVAFRYAFGFGKVVGLSYDLRGDTGEPELPQVDARVHELSLILATSVVF